MRQRRKLAVLIIGLVVVAILGVAPAAWAGTTFSNGTSIGVPDPNATGTDPAAASPYPSSIPVSGLTGNISSLTVTLSGIHMAYSQDLSVMLVGPGGQAISLFTFVGGNSQLSQTGATNGLNVTLDDSSSTSYAYNTNLPTTGSVTMKPADDTPSALGSPYDTFPSPAPGSFGHAASKGSDTLGATYDGLNPNGTWTLYVANDGPGDNANAGVTGSLSGGWSLNISTAPTVAATSTAISSDNNPSFTSSPGNGTTFTATVTSGGSPVTTGTVDFTDDGASIGCDAAGLNASGQATCPASFSTEGIHNVKATYSGTPALVTSSATVAQEVNNHTTVSGTSYCNTGPVSIGNTTDANPYPQRVFVPGSVSGTISHLSVTLTGVSEPFEQDIYALLVGPNGKDLILVGNAGPNGSPGQGSPAANNVTLTFDDGAATSLGASTPWGGTGANVTSKPVYYGSTSQTFGPPAPGGSYGIPAPGGSATLASQFDGASAVGTWSLYIMTTGGSDDAGGSMSGGWCATITTSGATATTTALASDTNPSFTTPPNNNVTFTATVKNAGDNSNVNEGTVDFTSGGATISGCGTVALSGGQATCATSFATEGEHQIQAQYSGDANFGPSNDTLTQVVDAHTTATGGNYCNASGITLNALQPAQNASPYPSRVFVSGLASNVSHLTVTLKNTSLAFSQDIQVLLVGPNGNDLILVSNAGANSAPNAAINDVTLTLDDASATTLAPSAPWGSNGASVTSKPINYEAPANYVFPSPAPAGPYGNPGPSFGGTDTLSSEFNGASPDGTWKLYVITTGGSSDGTGAIAGGWCLGVTTPKVDAPTTSTASNPTVALGDTSTDTATVHGISGYPPAGTVSFSVCGPLAGATGCATGGSAVGSAVTVTAGSGGASTASSSTFTPQSVGTYCYRADYSGDQNYNATNSAASNDCFTVGPASAAAASSPASSTIALPGTNADNVTITGNAVAGTPTGTVGFSVCGPLASATGCATGGTAVGGAVSLTGGPSDSATATSDAFAPTTPGVYCFRADYSGSTNYGTATDGTGAECFTVAAASTATSSTPGSTTITLGQTNTDGATVTGNGTGGSPTGTIAFSVCGPLAGASGCPTGGTAVGTAVALTPGSNDTATAGSIAFTPASTGTYCFRADYSGDSNYSASSDGTSDECFTVTVATVPSTTTSTLHAATFTLGKTNTDRAVVTGNGSGRPTGSVMFSVCGPLASASGCASGGTAVGSAVTLKGLNNNTAVARSSSFTPPSPGTYCFRADYSGDSRYSPSSDASGGECFTVSKAPGGISSTPVGLVPQHRTNKDYARVFGNSIGGRPTGTVSFSICGPLSAPTGCATGGSALGSPVALKPGVGNTATAGSATFTPGSAGTYCFGATYSGDSNYAGSSDGSARECFTVPASAAQHSVTISGPTAGGRRS